MKGGGWSWPAPGAPTCGRVAVDRAGGGRYSCGLRRGHGELCHYEKVVAGDVLVSVSWFAISETLPSYVGVPSLLGMLV